MHAKTLSLPPLLLMASMATSFPASAETMVLGVSDKVVTGNRNPALRHRDCAATYAGSHWCSTREYLEGGISSDADNPLPTAWIRPTIVGGDFKEDDDVAVYIDVVGIKSTGSRLNCRQWGSKNESDKGFALQTTENDKKQRVIQIPCNRKRPSLCCGLPED